MLTQTILNSSAALVFFLFGSLGFPSLPPIPHVKPEPQLRTEIPAFALENPGNHSVEFTEGLELSLSPEMARDMVQIVTMSDPKLRAQVNLLIKKYAKRHRMDEKLVKAVLRMESGGNPLAVSPKGAMGLMQLMPETATSMGVEDPFNPEQNLAGGVKYLKYCLNRFNQDLTLALAAYNAGPEAVKKYGGVPPFAETQQYVANILGCPVEDIIKKNKAAEDKKIKDNDPAGRFPKPQWKVVQSKVPIIAPKWKTLPSFAGFNSIPLKNGNNPEASGFSKTFSPGTEEGKDATSRTNIANPKFFKIKFN